MTTDGENSRARRESIGLCASCRFLREQQTRRGSVFFRCARADDDAAFLRYPPIPVERCPGHESGEAT